MSTIAINSLNATTTASLQQTLQTNLLNKTSTLSSSTSSSCNMLSGNFVQSNYKRSEFINATLSNLKSEQTFKDQMSSLFTDMQAQFALIASDIKSADGNPQYTASYIFKHRVEAGVSNVINQEITKESGNNLQDIKENIDKQTTDSQSADATTNKQSTDTTTTQQSTDTAANTQSTDTTTSAQSTDATAVGGLTDTTTNAASTNTTTSSQAGTTNVSETAASTAQLQNSIAVTSYTATLSLSDNTNNNDASVDITI